MWSWFRSKTRGNWKTGEVMKEFTPTLSTASKLSKMRLRNEKS